jgi:hypothetical protein
MTIFRSFVVCVFALAWLPVSHAADPVELGMLQLLGTPQRFQGQVVRVQGFLVLELEGSALYLHREDFERGLTKNAISVAPSPAFAGKDISGHYVLIEGEFDAEEKGHFDMFSGELKAVTFAARWPGRADTELSGDPQPGGKMFDLLQPAQ